MLEVRFYPNTDLSPILRCKCQISRSQACTTTIRETALEELNEEAVLPNPVRVRDMMLRAHLDADHSLEYNRLFVEYQKGFGELLEVGRHLLEGLAGSHQR